jgi:hypothetical protein
MGRLFAPDVEPGLIQTISLLECQNDLDRWDNRPDDSLDRGWGRCGVGDAWRREGRQARWRMTAIVTGTDGQPYVHERAGEAPVFVAAAMEAGATQPAGHAQLVAWLASC